MATFSELKARFGITESMGFFPNTDLAGEKTGWFSAFDVETRTHWNIPPSVVPVLKKSGALFLQEEERISKESGNAYTHLVVCIPKVLPDFSA